MCKTERMATDFSNEISEVLEYLNSKVGRKFTSKNRKTVLYLNRVFRDDHTVENVKTVIDCKVKEWLGTDMEKYLRPETLFFSKFQGYLEQSTVKENTEEESGSTFDVELYDKVLKELNCMNYKDYLETKHWKHFRHEALIHFNFKCQVCGSTEELEIHHNNYKNRGRETFNDVTCLCSECHAKFHDK